MNPIVVAPSGKEAHRLEWGFTLYLLGMATGAVLLFLLLRPGFVDAEGGGAQIAAMGKGALFALPMLLVYLWLPWIVDRYDPEPTWALLLTLSWGAVAAAGIAAWVNTDLEKFITTISDASVADLVGTCIGAPVIEEFLKGLGVFFMFYFYRREFDGVVDGVIYAAFAALGFAAIENVLYYGGAAREDLAGHGSSAFMLTFIMRGILAPWGHPLYTSMTGIGFGIARETDRPALKWMAPVGGYLVAVFLHAVWNTSAQISGFLTVLMLPLWLLFVTAFAGLVIYLVMRKGRIIREFLQDEIMMGILTPWEVELVTSPVAHLRATLSFGGSAGRRFVSAASRLALSKWHTGRATRGARSTVSAGMVLPLRQELGRLREEIARRLGRPVEAPRMAVPGGPR